jgi:hypothetical protein
MLRRLTGSIVPVTGTWFIDILKLQSLRVLKDASGDMSPAEGVLARDQVPAGFGVCSRALESLDSAADDCHTRTTRTAAACAVVMSRLEEDSLRGLRTAAPLKRRAAAGAFPQLPPLRGLRTAAPLKRWRSRRLDAAAGALRGLRTAAPLKQVGHGAVEDWSNELSPRSPDRGPVEAAMSVCLPNRAWPLRGLRTAAPLKPISSTAARPRPSSLRGLRTAAPLKRPVRSWGVIPFGALRGLRTAAPLKRHW